AMGGNLTEESANQISDGSPPDPSSERDHGQPHKQQEQQQQQQEQQQEQQHRQHQHHRQHLHNPNNNHNHNPRHQSTKPAAAKTQDRHQQPAVWSWLNALGADGTRMVTPSYPCSPPTHVPADSPDFGTSTSSVRRPPFVRRRSTLPTDAAVLAQEGSSANASRTNLAFDPRQLISTSGVLFGVSELFDWRPPHVDASHACVKCHTTETPEWRNGPGGPGTLCNVCGLVFAKKRARRDRDSWSLDVNNARGGC
ncbi:uncharacterized protein PpBr36_10863, partial [Pyricularia pennisetigena]|uniref:uncharacterized protein n=1 Tax=Pyricularia pennisetigena TaxID=1578925 RepID=UPI001154E375